MKVGYDFRVSKHKLNLSIEAWNYHRRVFTKSWLQPKLPTKEQQQILINLETCVKSREGLDDDANS